MTDQLDELSKDELERKKLAREINQLDAPWYRKPGYLALAIPITLGLFSTAGTTAVNIAETFTGLRDLKSKQMQLEHDTSRFALMADLLEREKQLVEDENLRLNSELKLVAEEKEQIADARSALEAAIDEERTKAAQANENAERELARLRAENASATLIRLAEEQAEQIAENRARLIEEAQAAQRATAQAKTDAKAARTKAQQPRGYIDEKREYDAFGNMMPLR